MLITHPDERATADTAESPSALRRVLVAHDFSDCSEVALKLALSLAREHAAELHLLHVLPPPLTGGPELAWSQSTVERSYHKAADALRRSAAGEPYLRCDVKTAVRWGKPYREVLAYAAEHDVDLFCMGAHGAGFGMQALVGSNVDRVASRPARCWSRARSNHSSARPKPPHGAPARPARYVKPDDFLRAGVLT